MATFLVSGANTYTTGQHFLVDGALVEAICADRPLHGGLGWCRVLRRGRGRRRGRRRRPPRRFAVRRLQRTDERTPLAEVTLLAPVEPSKVVAFGRNYAEHAKELGNEVPAIPIVFLKPSTPSWGRTPRWSTRR